MDDLDRIWQASVTHSVSGSVSDSDSVDWRNEGAVTSVCNLWIPSVINKSRTLMVELMLYAE